MCLPRCHRVSYKLNAIVLELQLTRHIFFITYQLPKWFTSIVHQYAVFVIYLLQDSLLFPSIIVYSNLLLTSWSDLTFEGNFDGLVAHRELVKNARFSVFRFSLSLSLRVK